MQRQGRTAFIQRRKNLRCEVLESRLLLAAEVFGPVQPAPIRLTSELTARAETLHRFVGPLLPYDAELAGLYAQQQARLDSLAIIDLDERPRNVGNTTPRINMPGQDNESLITAAIEKQHDSGVFSFATPIPIDINPLIHGAWTEAPEGMRQWSVEISSQGAQSLNLGFDRFVMPAGGQLVLSGSGGDRHVFTDADNEDHGELWSPIIPGNSVTLEATVPEASESKLQLRLGSVNYGFRDHGGHGGHEKIGGSTSGSCNIDVVCDSQSLPGIGAMIDEYRNEIRSVGAYTLNGIDTCSGALVNNTARDGTPYFLTADHCGITPANANTMVVYWNFECPTCRQPGSSESGGIGNGSLSEFNTGAIFRATSAASDFTLVELDDPVAASVNAFYAGWDNSGNEATSAVGIHHPAVAEKRISFELDATTTTSYLSNNVPGDGTHIRVADWDAGTTEGGSSGSPLFDQNHRIIGQLGGGFAACGNDESDWYGKLSVSWNGGGTSATRLSDWLDPLNTGAVAIDGLGEDFGDAPDSPFGTLLASNGPRHVISPLRLGVLADPDPNGAPTANANGDGGDDGIRIIEPPVAGSTMNIEVTSPAGGGILDFFFDFDGTGGFGNNANEVFSVALNGGVELVPVAIPATAVIGSTFARFRISSAGGLGPLGPANDGEVEDYALPIFASTPLLDFGDAPTATMLADDGPRHAIGGPQLGASVDSEADGQPSGTATGDGLDEDGVIFRESLVRGQSVDISILSGGGMLDYFFDFDHDGSFGNSPNEVFSAVLTGGEELITVDVPPTATAGVTRARFRISSTGGLSATGFATDGEIEDYQVLIVPVNETPIEDFDSVTAPAIPSGWTVSTTGANNWVTLASNSDTLPNHAFVQDIDSVSDAQLTSPSIQLTGSGLLSFRNFYDTESGYDGGVLELSVAGGAFQDILAAGGTFLSGAYNDTIANGFDNPLSLREAWSGDSGGFIDTVVSLPQSAVGQNVQFRWRMGTDESESGVGWRIDTIRLRNLSFDVDFGDAPDPSLPTLSASDGARHHVTGLSLGTVLDVDLDGQPTATASGDDDDGQDDEDGVTLPTSLSTGQSVIEVSASDAALLNVWIDVNGDNSWAGEQFVKDLPVSAGTNNVTLNLPAVAATVNTFARFRLSSQAGLWYDGTAPNGEVEDYPITIVQPDPPQVDEVLINDGDPQRSSITKVKVKFNTLVQIDDTTGDPFQFVKIGDGTAVTDTPVVSIEQDKTVVDFTFPPGQHVGPGGTLEDGAYRLIVNAALISANNLLLDGNKDGTGGDDVTFIDNFFRKYGDINGNNTVDLLDFAAFRQTFGKSLSDTGYQGGFDGDGDNTIGLLDFAQFRQNFGT